MLGIYLRNNHRYIRNPAAGAVAGDYRAFEHGIFFFQCARAHFVEIYCAEHKINHCGDFFGVGARIKNGHIFNFFGYWRAHNPAPGNSVLIAFARTFWRGRQSGDFEPRVLRKQCDKSLSHHSGGTDYADFICIQTKYLP